MANQSPTTPAQRRSHQIGQALLNSGLLTESQLAEAARSPLPLERAVVELGLASRADVVSALAASAGVPFVRLTPEMAQPDAMAALPAQFCAEHNLLPLMVAGEWLTVALEDFANLFLVEEIKNRSGRQVQPIAAEAANIAEVRRELLGSAAEAPAPAAGAPRGATAVAAEPEAAAPDDAEDDLLGLTLLTSDRAAAASEDTRDLEAAASGSPIIRLVNRIIRNGVERRASDIHIEPEDGGVRVRYRVDGDLVTDGLRPQARLLPAIVSRIKIMAGMDISQRRLPQDGGVTATLAERPIELRVSTMATPLGEKVVMRLTDNSAGLQRLNDLGFAPALLQAFRAAVRQPNGIVLVTGPTGSGKTTTLYAALSDVASDALNISAVEDPVERQLKGVNQFQVNPRAGFGFPHALRSLLRQDPDVIMVGEIRDAETAKLATEAALTGHLVLSTLHTNDAAGALPRLVNMGVEPYLVAAAVRAVLAQRLVRRLCAHCRRERPLSDAMKSLFASAGAAGVTTGFYGAGCDRCRGSGFHGRTSIHELLVADEEMLAAAGPDLCAGAVRKLATARGFTTMLSDAAEKVRAGVIAAESVLEVVGVPELPGAYPDGSAGVNVKAA
jgi:type IV pilus assembly protein PilB